MGVGTGCDRRVLEGRGNRVFATCLRMRRRHKGEGEPVGVEGGSGENPLRVCLVAGSGT